MNIANVNNIGNVFSTMKDRVKSYFISESTEKGVTDLRLDIIGEETLTADCDITDNYVESNISYQDQISLKPKIFTIQGEVGELVWYQRDPNQQGLGQLAQRLEGVISLLPVRSKSFNQMKSKVMKGLQWIDTASNAIDKINKLADINGNAQQQAYNHLISLRDNRTPLTIQSPWELLVDYVIQNVKFTQPKETKDKTLIIITFKEFRTSMLGDVVPFDESKYQGNAVFENQPKEEIGKVSGEYKETTEIDENGDMVKDIEDFDGSYRCTIDPKTFQPTKIVEKATGEVILPNNEVGDNIWNDFEYFCARDIEKTIAQTE